MEKDIELLKKVFGGDENLLKAMRALMLGLETSEAEKQMIKSTFSNAELLRIVRQRFLPSLDKDAPLGLLVDMWSGVQDMVFGRPVDTIRQAVEYKDRAIKMTEQALYLLTDPHKTAPSIAYGVKDNEDDSLQSFLLARNMFITHIDKQCAMLYLLAQSDDKEKTAELAKRLNLNSAR